MSRAAIVYEYIFENGKRYIGVTYSDREDIRKSDHKTLANRGQGFAFHSAIRKYGYEKIKYNVLCYCSSMETAKIMEKAIIKQFNTICPNGYNIAEGGEGGPGAKKDSIGYKIMRDKITKKQGIKIELSYADGNTIGEFNSYGICAEYIQNLTGIKTKISTITSAIARVANGERKHYRGFYINKLRGDKIESSD